MVEKLKKFAIPVVVVIAVIYALKSFAPSFAAKLKL